MTGRPSLARLFQRPEITAPRAISDERRPKLRWIDTVTPTPIAEPPGKVLETAVDAKLEIAAS
jgi:hypothetical protein